MRCLWSPNAKYRNGNCAPRDKSPIVSASRASTNGAKAMERPMTAAGRAAARQVPPTYVCKLPNGEICVAQEPNHQLLCLTLSGELRNVVDPAGEVLQFPTGIACDGEKALRLWSGPQAGAPHIVVASRIQNIC